MISLVNKILSKLIGMKITKVTKTNRVIGDKAGNKKPMIAEFVGVPGVGKTTIYKQLMLNKGLFLDFPTFYKTHQGGSRFDTLNRKDVYDILSNEKLKQLNHKDFDGIDKIWFISILYQVLWQDNHIVSLNKSHTVVLEEGVLHNFSNCFFNKNLNTTKRDLLESFLKNRCIVYCNTSPDIVVNNINKRYETTGHILPQHKNKTQNELLEYLTLSLSIYREFVDLMSSYSVPILNIDTAKDAEDNAEKVKTFLEELQNGKT